MYSLGGASHAPPPQKKALDNSYRVEMHLYSPIFQGQLIEKKIRSITFRVWVLGKVDKKYLKKVKKMLKIFFFVFNKYQSVTHVSTPIFQGLFKNIVFRSVAVVIKKSQAILDFFLHTPDFLPPCTLPYAKKKTKINKKILQITIYEKSKISR